jgi:polysaccharide chain length determinant protein (PEP-CTERM system associated)
LIPGKQYRPEDFLRIAWRRKWLIAIPFALIASATTAWTFFLPNVYRSQTLIMVVPQRVPETYVQSTVTMRIEDRLQAISQQILSRPRLERIIDEFNLYPEQRRIVLMEDIVARMRSEIDPQIVRGDAFRISYVYGDPRTAMRVVERLASLFIEENLRDREVLAEGTNQFLEAQLEDARKRLIDQEKKLADYRLRHASEMPDHLEAHLQAQHNAEMQVQALVNQLSIDHDRRRNLERQIAELSEPLPPETIVPVTRSAGDAPPATATEELAAARSGLAALQLRLTPEHPDVIRAKRLIAELEVKAAAESSRASGRDAPIAAAPAERARLNRLNDLRKDLESLNQDIARTEEREKRLHSTIDTYQERIQAIPLRETELSELTRDYNTISQLYQGLLQRHESAKIAANLERRQQGEQFKVIEPAHLPERPYSPNRLQLNAMGAALGLAIGLALAALLEYFDTSMRSEEDVLIALAVPVVALIPHVRGIEDLQVRRRRVLLWGGAAVATILMSVAGVYLYLTI